MARQLCAQQIRSEPRYSTDQPDRAGLNTNIQDLKASVGFQNVTLTELWAELGSGLHCNCINNEN